MPIMSRRSIVRTSLGGAAAWTLVRPYIAHAAATTATVWWVQGFAEEEDVSFKKIVADYEKASGNTIEYSIIPYAPERQKIVSAMTSGVVPDLFQNNPFEIVALYAWDDKLVDVSDVVATQKEEYTEAALLSAYCYNRIEKRRSFYGVPYTASVSGNHIWGSLVQKAGYTIEDIPKTWNAFYDFFKGVQRKLSEQGMRHVYGLGFQVTTNGADPNSTFNNFLIAYGGQSIVTSDGKLHLDDPQVQKAAIEALTYPTTAYKEGFVPPSAINWNDADDNNAFHAKTIVMDLDGSISTEVAIFNKKEDYDDIVTMGLPFSNTGKPVPSSSPHHWRPDPKGGEKCRGGKGVPQIFDRAERRERVLKGRARPERPVHAVDRQTRPVVVRGPASKSLHDASAAQPDDCGLLGVQPRLCAGAERACLANRVGRHHDRRDDATGRRRKGFQTGGRDFLEISG